MLRIVISLIISIQIVSASAQKREYEISEFEVGRIVTKLASDSMMGRANGSEELNDAAAFIAREFAQAGLSVLDGQSNYFIPFQFKDHDLTEAAEMLTVNDQIADQWQFHFISPSLNKHKPYTIDHFSVVKINSFFTQDIILNLTVDRPLLLWSNNLQPDSVEAFPEVINLPTKM